MKKSSKTNPIPPLTVYASANLPKQEIAASYQQIQRTTPTLSAHYYKKKQHPVLKTKDQIQRGKETLRQREEDVLRGFAREMRRELSLYRKQIPQPNVPLEIFMSTLSCLWVNGELSGDILRQFQASDMEFLVLNTYFYGGNNIVMLLSFQKRTYLVVCEGAFAEYLDVLSAPQRTLRPDEPHRLGDLSFQMNRPIATALPRMPSHKILFAIPIVPDTPTVKPSVSSLLLEPI